MIESPENDAVVDKFAEFLVYARARMTKQDLAVLLATGSAMQCLETEMDAVSMSTVWREGCQTAVRTMAARVRAQRAVPLIHEEHEEL